MKPKTRDLVIMSFLYWALHRVLELILLGFRSEDAKEVEFMVLRHQLHSSSSSLLPTRPT